MLCPRCRTENRDGRRFCSKCGAALAAVCPSCGFTNEPGDEFCGGCGARLGIPHPIEAKVTSPAAYTPRHLAEKILTSKVALEGERKQVTVLFADLKGSMELLADRDPEALAGELGMRPLIAHCHLGLGKLYGRTGDRQQAHEHLTTATTMYREMDMRFYLEQAEAAMREMA
jgi:Double zinc ribbon